MVKIRVVDGLGRPREVEATAGLSVMENIRGLDAGVDAICGGMCACATCHVYVGADWQNRLPTRSYEETFMLKHEENFDPDRSRLSCQIRMEEGLDGLQITVAKEQCQD